jgi:hypothetical protein
MSFFSWGAGKMWNWAVLLIFCGNLLLQKSKNFFFRSVRKTAHLHVAPVLKNWISISIWSPSMTIILKKIDCTKEFNTKELWQESLGYGIIKFTQLYQPQTVLRDIGIPC